jgi:hypothetical protein
VASAALRDGAEVTNGAHRARERRYDPSPMKTSRNTSLPARSLAVALAVPAAVGAALAALPARSAGQGYVQVPPPVVAPSPYQWIPAAGGVVPQGAVIGGWYTGGPLFVCRAPYNGGIHPGKIVGANCNIGWGGREITLPSYEVLVGPTPRWVAASGGAVPARAVIGGGENGHALFICSATYNNGFHPGKVVGTNCNIGWGGAVVLVPSYLVPVY